MIRFLRASWFLLFVCGVVFTITSCEDDDCNGDGARCNYDELPCCEGLTCKESVISPGDLVCR